MPSDEPVYIAGAFEHPTREAPNKSTVQLHAEVARGALDDAGLSKDDVDGYATAGVPQDANILGPIGIVDYLGLDPDALGYLDTTELGGPAYMSHVGHAASAIRDGKADVVLVTFANRPRSSGEATGTGVPEPETIQSSFESIYGPNIVSMYAMMAQRHMHEYGTTSAQLAEIRAAASHHAQYNEHALYQDVTTVEDVLDSRVIADPLHLLDCCVITDGGGAVLVVSESVKDDLDRECVEVLGHGETVQHHPGKRLLEPPDDDLTALGARYSGESAYEEAGVGPEDVDYVSIYDSFTITVLLTLEDLGFCEKGAGGEFVEGGTLHAPDGDLPFNTDGGGLCSNHPNRGGMLKLIESVNQIRGEANSEVQVEDADVALAHGTGGGGSSPRHAAVTTILGADR
jgi:acetyl-CoA C-acetyltransferase